MRQEKTHKPNNHYDFYFLIVFEARYSEMEWMINKNATKEGGEEDSEFVSVTILIVTALRDLMADQLLL